MGGNIVGVKDNPYTNNYAVMFKTPNGHKGHVVFGHDDPPKFTAYTNIRKFLDWLADHPEYDNMKFLEWTDFDWVGKVYRTNMYGIYKTFCERTNCDPLTE